MELNSWAAHLAWRYVTETCQACRPLFERPPRSSAVHRRPTAMMMLSGVTGQERGYANRSEPYLRLDQMACSPQWASELHMPPESHSRRHSTLPYLTRHHSERQSSVESYNSDAAVRAAFAAQAMPASSSGGSEGSNGELNRRDGFHYQPVNQTAAYVPPAPQTPPPREETVAETTSLTMGSTIPLSNLDVEYGTTSLAKPQMHHFRYGSFSSDSSSFTKQDLQSLRRPRWLPDSNLSNHDRVRYWSYYLPALTWMPQYQLEWFRGDALAALTVASLYIPMCFSFAMLGQVEPVNGLYAFIIHPFIYALLGSCPQMIVGPEATGSLMVGAIIHQVQTAASSDEQGFVNENAHISGVATAIAGAMLLIAGLGRIGYVDSVLNRPFMQGFICGVGFVLVIEQAIPELHLGDLAQEAGVAHSSAIVKLWFLLTHLSKGHLLTAVIAFCSLGFILVTRFLQKRYRSIYPSIALFPDRLLIIIVTTFLTSKYALEEKGLLILGSLGSSTSTLPTMRWPLQSVNEIEMVFSTSFLIALLGFFESSVTAKSLRPQKDALQATSLSANRELIALGAANMVGGCFTTLPAFGGFGRSKLNAQTGGTTPMSSLLLSFISLCCVFFVLPFLYYVPKAVLSAMASAVGISMMEECPHDIRFFYKVKGWNELFLMVAVFLATALYSMSLGIAVGILITLFNLVHHSTRSRVRILGRMPGSRNAFEDTELVPDSDQIEQCLIVRIPEPLTFANVGDLRTRLGRFGRYGTHAVHPSLPRLRTEDRFLIFDVQGLTEIDACGVQVLTEIVQEQAANGTQVLFSRLRPGNVMENFRMSGIVDIVGGARYFVESVEDGLKIAGTEK